MPVKFSISDSDVTEMSWSRKLSSGVLGGVVHGAQIASSEEPSPWLCVLRDCRETVCSVVCNLRAGSDCKLLSYHGKNYPGNLWCSSNYIL